MITQYNKLCTEFYDNDKALADNEELEFYNQILSKDMLILEPMCGSGRLLIPMLKEGYKVHGVDNSIHMLASCRKRLKEHNLTTELFTDSIIDMKLPYKYDAIVIPVGSFQLLYPRKIAYKALDNFNNHLKLGGKLIMDTFIPWEALYKDAEEDFSERAVTLSDGSVVQHKAHDKANKFEQYYHNISTYEKVKDGKIIETEKEEITICWYYFYELELILEKHGFGNIKMTKRIVNGSEHQTYIAEKIK